MLEGPTEYANTRWIMVNLHELLYDIIWIMFHGHLDYFQKPHLGGRRNTKQGDHDTMNSHNRWFILFYHVRGPAWTNFHWNNIWLRDRSHMTPNYTWGFVTALHDDFEGVLGRRPLDTHFLLGSHNFMVTALAHVWSWPSVACNPPTRVTKGPHFPQNSLSTSAALQGPTPLINNDRGEPTGN